MDTITDEKNVQAIETEDNHNADKWLEIFSLFIHDIESPLATMKYLLKLINDGRFNYEKQTHRQIVSSTEIAMKRSEAIIYDILAVVKSGDTGLPVKMTELKPGPLIEEVVNMANGAAAENGIDIKIGNICSNDLIKADAHLLKRTLDNFVFNALRHTPTNGEIIVYTSTENNSVYIHVKDSGAGLGDIEPDILFEKFGQVDLRAKRKHRGVGLGLYFCKLAAIGMGGTVMADDHPDGGAVFSVKLQKAKGRIK